MCTYPVAGFSLSLSCSLGAWPGPARQSRGSILDFCAYALSSWPGARGKGRVGTAKESTRGIIAPTGRVGSNERIYKPGDDGCPRPPRAPAPATDNFGAAASSFAKRSPPRHCAAALLGAGGPFISPPRDPRRPLRRPRNAAERHPGADRRGGDRINYRPFPPAAFSGARRFGAKVKIRPMTDRRGRFDGGRSRLRVGRRPRRGRKAGRVGGRGGRSGRRAATLR